MHVAERFIVPADSQTVWGVLSDPRTIVTCVPGASLGEQHEDGSFDANVAVKFGPVRVTLQARVTLEVDDASRVGHATARGKDNQGGTRFSSSMTFTVSEHDRDGSTVAIDGQVELSGRLAGVIEGGAPIVIKRMSGEFAENLARRCAEVTAGSTQEPMESRGETA
jgi:carbon monoxide dehydrogenase subunit G